MRPVETLLVLVNLLTFFVLALPPLRAVRWTGYVAVIALLIAGVQMLREGPRWQMIPAYVLSGLFLLVRLLQAIKPASLPALGGLNNSLVAGLAIGLGGLGLTVSIALPTILPVFGFPHPTGPYGIGTLTYHWVDASRPEVFATDPNARRELTVQIWYPAKANPSALRAPYLPDADALAPAVAQLLHFPEFTFAHLKYVTSDAIPFAAVADDQPSYPVLIFLEGLDGYRQMNTFQVEELVSHGYIVAAIDQPYAAATVVFPDGHQVQGWDKAHLQPLIEQSIRPADPAPTLNGRAYTDGIVPYFAQDAVFTLDQLAVLNQADPNGILTGRLDLHRAGAFGISLGAIIGSQVCNQEPRLRACLLMDAPMTADAVQDGLKQPSMWITRDAQTMQLEGWSQADIAEHQTTMHAAYERLTGEGYFVRVRGMFHLNLTDLPYWSPLMPWLGATGPINAQRAHNIVNAYSLAFFDQHLKDQPAALLDGPAQQYPDVLFETRRP